MWAIQFRNELLKLVARKRTYIGFGVFLFVEAIVLGLFALSGTTEAFGLLLTKNGLELADGYTGLTLAGGIVYITVAMLGALYMTLVSGDMVAKEVEDGTMRMILSRPVSRLRVIAIKAAVCVVHTFALVFFIGLTSLLAGALYRGGLGNLVVFAPHEGVFAILPPGEGLRRYLLSLFFIGLTCQTISALGLMFSCFRMRPATATILALSVFSVDFILRTIPYFNAFRGYFLTHHIDCWIHIFEPFVPWGRMAESLLLLAGLTISFWVIGAAGFCSRDLKA